MGKLAGKQTSLWLDTTPETNFPTFDGSKATYDVVVVGAGIAGLLAAYFLEDAGLTTVVIEKEQIIQNTTGNTTAKLTSQHYLIYDWLIRKYGRKTAQIYADASQQAIDDIDALAVTLNINCDFSRRDAYVYTNEEDKLRDIHDEVKAAKSLGLLASFESKTDLPFDVRGALKFAGQAQFHPRKFLLGITDHLVAQGTPIYENTEATGIKPGSPNVLQTKQGEIKAKYIIEATKYPFWQPDMFKDAMWRKLSYALGIRLKDGAKYPQGMYITTDTPLRTIRSHPYEGDEILIFGGNSHKLEGDYNKDEHWQNLLDDAPKYFPVKEVIYRWIAGDNMPYDKLPYIGPYPKHPNIYIATGFRAWGLTWAMVAAQIISDDILGELNDWSKTFSLGRLKAP